MNEWSADEVEAVVRDYCVMLAKELRGERYNKTVHRGALAERLSGRSDGSIERKHQNISAVLIELGYPYIFGYKPLGNYQRLLAEAVAVQVVEDYELTRAVRDAVEAPARPGRTDDILDRLESPPQRTGSIYPFARDTSAHAQLVHPKVNYLERESRNISLGRRGEEFVLSFERARLIRLGLDELAEQIEHTSMTEGDGAGFDIRSFERDGSSRLIEVKATAFGKQTPFFLSKNELEVSRRQDERYHLYRVFRLRDDPRLFTLRGAMDRVCELEAVQFVARTA